MNNNENRKKYLIKNTIIFAIGNFSSKLITFFLVPLYTYALNTSEYGVVDLLYTICNFLIPLFSFNIVESILRFSLDKQIKNNKITSIALVSIIFMFSVGLITIPILNIFKNYSEMSILFYLYMVTLGMSQIFLVMLKGKEKIKLFSLGNILYTVMISIFNILFLVIFKMGMQGYFLAYIISNIFIFIYSIVVGDVVKDIKNFEFDKYLFKDMIKYSLLLIPTSFMWWIMNFMDRVMVTNIISASANGIYAISYKIPTVLSVLSSVFTQAWLFSAVREKDSIDNQDFTNKMFNFLAFGTSIVGMILLIIIKPLYSIYVSNDFFEAWNYVPPLIIGYIFLNLSTFISTSYNVHKDSRGFLVSAVIGAVVNFVLNFLLIPTIGIFGAAIATSISYFCVFLFRLFDTKKYIVIKIDSKFICIICMLFLMSIFTYINNIYIVVVKIFIVLFSIVLYKNIWKPLLLLIINKIFKKKVTNE